MDDSADQLALDLGYVPLPPLLSSTVLSRVHDMHCAAATIGGSSGDMNVSPVLVSGAGAVDVGTVLDPWSFAFAEDHPSVHVQYTEVW